MLRTLWRRILWAIPLFLLITFFIFLMFDLAAVDPAERIAGEAATPDQVAALRTEFGLHGSVLSRYSTWLGNVMHGDFGTSYVTREKVTQLIGERYSVTLSLSLLALVLSLVIAIPMGIAAAMRPRGPVDRLVTVGASLGISVPGFWLAVMLVLLFAVKLKWLPAIGYEPLSAGLTTWFRYLILPVIALALLGTAAIALQTKAAMIEVLGSDYILAAQAKGLPRRTVIGKHALKNAAIPVVTILGFRVAGLFGGSVLIESVFAMDGMGSLAVRSTLSGDLPVIIAITVITVLMVVVVNLAVDMSYLYFDPRTRK